MSDGQPASAASASARRTVERARRRRRVIGVVLAGIAAYAAFSAIHRPARSGGGMVDRRASLSSVRWPAQGEAALRLGTGRAAASPDERPVAIASLAKVMTAYLTLERFPLTGAQNGFAITVSAAEAQVAASDRAGGQSVVAVAPGERLTERELLEALLVPSGNNIAWLLADRVAGSDARFVAEMNAAARELGMTETTYTDPSGFAPSTVSTAADQLRALQAAMRFVAFRRIVSMGSVTLPVAGTLTNFDPLIADGYAGKTGSDSAAGGCLAFFTRVTVGGHPRTAVGIVLGQGQGSDTSLILAAAGEAARELVGSVAATDGMGAGSTKALPPAPSSPP